MPAQCWVTRHYSVPPPLPPPPRLLRLPQQDSTSQLAQHIAEALALSVNYVRWDASLDAFVVTYGRLQEMLQVCCVAFDLIFYFLTASGAKGVCKLREKTGYGNGV
jgi:hypothetical protein